MKLPLGLVALLFIPLSSVATLPPAKRQYSTHDYYVLEHDPLVGASLAEVLDTLGLEFVEQAGELRNHWLLRRLKSHRRIAEESAEDVIQTLAMLRSRAASSHDSHLSIRHAHRVLSSMRGFSPQPLRQRVKRDTSQLRAPPPIRPDPSDGESNSSSHAIATRLGILDPEFTDQWHLVNDEFPTHMVNVSSVWEMGVTGEGVIAAMVDDGLDFESDDLAGNFVSKSINL